MKEQMRKAVGHWLSTARQFQYETDNFSVSLYLMNRDELTNLKPVSSWFLDFAPFMFKVTAPASHAKLRTCIAYLTTLQGLQAMAWQEYQTDVQKRIENAKQWVRQHQK